ncbi:MAG: hypothetical protein LIO62_07295 [Clostridiales bacterium]|nr:hypothetical protein [Clostridiales bacterium]
MKKSKNTLEEKLKNLAKERISNYAVSIGAALSETEYGKIIMNCSKFIVEFTVEYANSNGYCFMEYNGNGIPDDYCLVTRFKFAFSDVSFSPYDIHNATSDTDFRPLDFHCIADEKMMSEACDEILAFIACHKFDFENAQSDTKLQSRLIDSYKHDLAVASKKISWEELNSNTEKYESKHQLNMFFYHKEHQEINNFILEGQVKKLQTFFAKQSAKGKLLLIEQRYMEFLMSSDFQPVDDDKKYFLESSTESTLNTAKLNVISGIIAIVCGFVLDYALQSLYVSSKLKDWVILKLDSDSFPVVIVVLLFFALNIILKETFFKKSSAKSYISRLESKKEKTAIILLIAVLLAGAVSFDYYFSQQFIAVGDSGVYTSTSRFKKEIISYENTQFFVIGETANQSDSDEYYDNESDCDLIIVFNNDYENYTYSDDNISEGVETIKKNSGNLTYFDNIDEFLSAYNLE